MASEPEDASGLYSSLVKWVGKTLILKLYITRSVYTSYYGRSSLSLIMILHRSALSRYSYHSLVEFCSIFLSLKTAWHWVAL